MGKIVRTNLSDQIFDYIQNEIIRGTWKSGSKLPSESDLAKTLGVSRMSLRNGIQRCNAIGLTETRVGEGTFVRHFNLRSYFENLYRGGVLNSSHNEINDFRFILQIGSMWLALATDIKDEDIHVLETLFEKMEKAAAENDMDTFHEADCQFHRCVCGLCKNELVYMLYDMVEYLIDDVMRENVTRSVKYSDGFEYVLSHHREIVDSLKDRDWGRFVTNLENTNRRSSKLYDEDPR